MQTTSPETTGVEIAIVGMAGRFPGAPDVDTLWAQLRAGAEAVTPFTDEQLRARGVSPELLADPDYVRAGVVLEDIDQFDAAFFGYTPREAERLDPQHRLFLECAWEALENAGYDAQRFAGAIAVYGGAGANLYMMRNLLPAAGLDAGSRIAELLGLVSGNAADALCTRVAYKLNLRGPAITVQTACSTSLTAIHLAGRSLLAFDCDMALAGGVSLNLLQNGGYRYEAGAIFSPDGHCRAFDAQAAGTVLGSGAGIVVLKRLEDALRDGDTIRAVIKGSAANNDGADKVGFTAPGVRGQASVIRAAQLMADVPAETIGYVEAHGTGTALGDPIEIAALTQAFRASTARRGFCALGSIKTNIGHLDAAAGVSGLIKAAKSLEERTLVPSLHFERAHPQLALETSPFFVNTEARPWPQGATPRRAAVSGFGIGGTNVHVVLEEAPMAPVATGQAVDDEWQVLPLSALDATALRQAAARLADHLEAHPELPLADVAHTLQLGRRAMPLRRAVVAPQAGLAIETLRGPAHALCPELRAPGTPPEVVFLFPGGGTQHASMGRALYRSAPLFREELDRCCELLQPALGLDLRTLLFPAEGGEAAADAQLFQIALAQPALFAVQYAMARLWMSRGVRPALMMGHSLGEYVAACLAGVFSLEDALFIAATRGRLLQTMAPGAMTAIPLPEAELGAFTALGCDIGAVNGESLCVLSGPIEAIEAAERALAARGHPPRRLRVSIASHSAMTEPVLAELEKVVAAVPRQAPRIPFISNVTGRLVTPEQATSPRYWAEHLRGAVRFWDGLGTLFAVPGRAVLEVGPGETLSGLARAHPGSASAAGVWASQAHPQQQARNPQQMAQAVAGLWSAGVEIDWAACQAGAPRRRVPLPSYPFQRRRHWVDASPATPARPAAPGDWAYIPSWQRVAPLASVSKDDAAEGCTLVLGEQGGFADRLAQHLAACGDTVVRAVRGERFAALGPRLHAVRPSERADLEQWLATLETPPARVCCLWPLDDGTQALAPAELLERGFHSLLALVQALGTLERPLALTVVASRTEDLTGHDPLSPEAAMLFGLCKSAGQEYPRIACRLVDALAPAPGSLAEARRVEAVAAEMRHAGDDATPVAYRGAHRWIKRYEPMPRVPRAAEVQRLRRGGVYLITGGLGGVGLVLAEHLARHWGARLGLLGRSACPPRADWEVLAASPAEPASLRARLQRLLALEAMGTELLVLQADVADPAQMRGAVAALRERFGSVHGVVHAAGDAGGGMIAHKTRAGVADVFAPKVAGSRALFEALGDAPLDFVLLCSSIASLAGGLGKSDYAAANAYLDAVAALSQRDRGYPVFSVNWDAWRDMGMAAGMQLPEGVGMNAQEGARAFERIVSGPALAQIVVCTTDLAQRLGPLDNGMLALLDAVDDSAPPAATHPRPSLQTPYAAPESELERAVAAIWQERLGIAPVGLHDNLFELGGDSLIAIQLLSRIKAACAVELHPSEFFQQPTVAGIAAQVARQGGAVQGGAAQRIPPVPRAAEMPLAPMQRRLWLVDRLSDRADHQGRAAYNIGAALALEGEIDLALLRETLQAIVARHEVLRTAYAENEGGEPVAVIAPQLRLDIPLIEAASLPGEDEAARLEAVFERIGRVPFELATGPLMRAAIVRLGAHRHAMVIVVHHIVFDGWSIAVFAREFGAIYQALQAGRAPALAPLPIQYVDYAVWCAQAAGAGDLAREQAFWRGYLQDAPAVTALPADRSRAATASHAGAAVHVRVEAERVEALRRRARESGVSLFHLLLAGFFLLVHRETAARDIVVGTDVAGRARPELEGLLGFFVNVIPLRSRVEATGMSLRDWLAALRQGVLSAMDHQHTPFDQIVDLLGAPRTRNRNPLVQMLFVLQNTPEVRFEIPGVAVDLLPQPTRESKFDIAVFAKERGDALEVEWVYATALYERDSVERLAAGWLALLREITDTPDAPLDRFLPATPQRPVQEPPVKEMASMNLKLDKLNQLAARERPAAPVRTSFLSSQRSFPIVLEAVDAGLDAVAWARAQAGTIELLVRKHGGILLRNFGLATPQDFEAFAEAIEPELYGSYGDLPKKEGGRNTYRSTPYPEKEMILFHNESAHLHRWPRKQWFYCELPSAVGGATPIVDCREMLAQLPAQVVEAFERKGLLYVRTFTPGLDVRWQDFYKTDSRAEVESRLATAGTEWRWLGDDTLQTRTRCPAVIRHPLTGDRVFFNQIQLHHVSCLDAQLREDLLSLVGLERMPRHVYYGDGSPIADETMALVGRAYEACAVRFDWRQGDVVMLDNMLAAHARDPYVEPRRIVVAMGAMFDRADLAPRSDGTAGQVDEEEAQAQ